MYYVLLFYFWIGGDNLSFDQHFFRPCLLVVCCLSSEQLQKRVVFLCISLVCSNNINSSFSNSKQPQPTIKYSKCNNNQVLYRLHVSYFYFFLLNRIWTTLYRVLQQFILKRIYGMYFNSQTMNYKFLLTFVQSEKFCE